jgi:hypothetical protein
LGSREGQSALLLATPVCGLVGFCHGVHNVKELCCAISQVSFKSVLIVTFFAICAVPTTAAVAIVFGVADFRMPAIASIAVLFFSFFS